MKISKNAIIFAALFCTYLGNSQTISSFPYSENFEAESLCGVGCGAICNTLLDWSNPATDNLDWFVNSGTTATSSTGPTANGGADHNPGTSSGKYVYVETSCNGVGHPNSRAELESPWFDMTAVTNANFSFWYHAFGTGIGALNVEARITSASTWTNFAGPITDNNDGWQQWQGCLPSVFNGVDSVQIRFVYVSGNDSLGDFAIDDINLEDVTLAPLNLANDTICMGGASLLNATSTNSSYLWSTGGTTSTIFAQLAGVYSVTVTDTILGCSSTDSMELLVNSLPQPNIGPDTVACNNYTIVSATTGNAPFTYIWNSGETTSTINVTTSGFYTVSITDSNGCANSATVPVTINSVNVDLGPDFTFCDLYTINSFNTTGLGPLTYLWNTGETTPSINATSTGTYSATITDANGCAGVGSVFITINTASNDLGPDVSSCDSYLIDGTDPAASSYNWATGETTPTISTFSTFPYVLTVTDTNGCEAIDTINVTINSTNVFLGNDITACDTHLIDGTNTAGSTYSWNTGETTPLLNIVSTGDYNLTVIDANGCTDSDTINVIINSASVGLGADVTVCDSVIIDGTTSGASTYTWNTGETAPMININNTGEYILTIVDANGCSDSDTLNVTVNSANVDLGMDVTECDTYVIDGTNAAGSTYSWNSGETTPMLGVFNTGNYILTVLSADGCTDSDTINVVINAASVDLGVDAIACDSYVINGTTSGANSYSWNTGETTALINVTTTNDYILTIVDMNGCSASDTLTVIINSATVDLGMDVTECDTYVIDGTNAAGSTYSWNSGETTPMLGVNNTGNYILTVVAANGCTDSDTVNVVINFATIDLGIDTTVCDSVPYILDAGMAASYLWNDLSTNPTLSTNANGTYSISIIDTNGCEATDSISLTFINCSLGLNDYESTVAVNLYPNPTSKFLTINLPEYNGIGNYTIFNIQGKEVAAGYIGATNTNLDVSALSNGTYMIRIELSEASVTKKFIINK